MNAWFLIVLFNKCLSKISSNGKKEDVLTYNSSLLLLMNM